METKPNVTGAMIRHIAPGDTILGTQIDVDWQQYYDLNRGLKLLEKELRKELSEAKPKRLKELAEEIDRVNALYNLMAQFAMAERY